MPVSADCRGLVLVPLLLVMACVPAVTTESPARSIAATDPVDFIVLGRGSRSDCGTRRDDEMVCRVRDNVSIPEIRARVAAGTFAWREGDAIIFVHEGTADAVDLTGTLEYPMSRVRGTDLWVVKLRVPELDRAILSYAVTAIGDRIAAPSRPSMQVWRGPAAPAEALKSARVQGRLMAEVIDSRALGHPRTIHVYLPPDTGVPEAVVYLGDGDAVRGLAPYVDTLITAGSLPRVMLVGMESAVTSAGDSPRLDPRALEYLWNYDTLNTRFLAHERFFLDEVMPWAESKHGAPAGRGQRVVFGVSNGGGWAMQMGLRNPDRFGHAIAFSPGGVPSGHMTPAMRFTPAVRFLLLSGSLEPTFNRVTEVWADEFRAKGLDHRVINMVAGHDWNVWRNEFGEALQWAFGEGEQ